MEIIPNYIGGSFENADQSFDVRNPYSDLIIGRVSLAGWEDADRSINRALEIKAELQNLPTYQIAEALIHISNNIKSERERLASILAKESGKPIRYALGEVDRAAQTFLVASEESKRIHTEYIDLEWTSASANKEGIVKRFPVGIIAGIAPFNFPLNLVAHKVAPAIAARCPIIIKPSPRTPLMSYELSRIIDQTGLPKGTLSVLNLSNEDTEKLVKDDRLAMISFTGSDKVGWYLKSICGKKKIALELGGNAGVIITESANIEHAVQRCLIGGFAYSGQVCIHTQRIFVHSSVISEFTKQYVEQARQLKTGDPLDESTEIANLIDGENAIRIEEWVNEALASGAELLSGGNRQGSFYEPTVLTNTSGTMKVCNKELFGPVVVVEKYNDFSGAIDCINNSEFGLQAGVFSEKNSEISAAFNQLEVGGVVINDVPTFRVDHMPYGGVKNSGFGREGLKYAILEMTEPRILVQNKH